MLLWEALIVRGKEHHTNGSDGHRATDKAPRLPYDTRCAAITKSGTRCRGRIHKSGDYCVFHDPEIVAKRRQRSTGAAKRHRRLSHLPDGYLRKLTSITAVGNAMDRLYREVRLGTITPEMGRVLFGILTRLQDSGLAKTGPCPDRTRAARLRPKLADLLTRRERMAWEKAIAPKPRRLGTPPLKRREPADRPAALVLQVAS